MSGKYAVAFIAFEPANEKPKLYFPPRLTWINSPPTILFSVSFPLFTPIGMQFDPLEYIRKTNT